MLLNTSLSLGINLSICVCECASMCLSFCKFYHIFPFVFFPFGILLLNVCLSV